MCYAVPYVAVNDEEQLAKKIREKLLEECDDPLALRDKVLYITSPG